MTKANTTSRQSIPKLSLCFPTYNRAPLLRQALDAVLVQAVPETEVVVSDNASSDGTASVLSEAQAMYPEVCLRVSRQEVNVGPDANIYAVIRQARGEFVYVLSDDDVLLPGGVAKLLDLMRVYPEADALSLNIRSFAGAPGEDGPAWFAGGADVFVPQRDAALACFRPMQFMFLSVFAFRRDLASRDYSRFAGTNLLQSYIFADVLARGRGLAVSAEPFLAQRLDNTGGWAFWRVMTTGLADLWDYAAQAGFDRVLLSRLFAVHLRTDLLTATRYYALTGRGRALGLSSAANRDGARRLLHEYGPRPLVLFVYLPLLLAPPGFWPGLRRAYKALRPGVPKSL